MLSKEFPFLCSAHVDYEPRTPCGKGGNPWWLILRTDDAIIEYYQWWIESELRIKLQRPLFGAHISVIRGEEPIHNSSLWKIRQGESLQVYYSPFLEHAEGFWWLPILCPQLEEIRLELGLSPQPQYGFHMTVGRVS